MAHKKLGFLTTPASSLCSTPGIETTLLRTATASLQKENPPWQVVLRQLGQYTELTVRGGCEARLSFGNKTRKFMCKADCSDDGLIGELSASKHCTMLWVAIRLQQHIASTSRSRTVSAMTTSRRSSSWGYHKSWCRSSWRDSYTKVCLPLVPSAFSFCFWQHVIRITCH